MISRFGNKNFFAAHYELVALGVGVLALCGGAAFYVMSLGEDPDEAAAGSVAEVARLKPAETGVKALDMEKMRQAVKLTRNPVKTPLAVDGSENFLTSEKMLRCMNAKCGKAISAARDRQKKDDGEFAVKCRYCGTWQEGEKKVVLDADGDGMPDKWEVKYGLNPNDPKDAALDSDKDGFTNLEECQLSAAESKTGFKYDPTDATSHPSYLDSLSLKLPLKETYLPFIFTAASKIPTGWRCEFYLPKQKDTSGYGRKGRKVTATVGEEVADSGFVLKSYDKKETKREIKGGAGMQRTVDVSEVVVERKGDGKKIKLVIAESLKEKPVAVDVQATLYYDRGEGQSFECVTGSELVLNGVTYKVSSIRALGKGAEVTVEGKDEKRVLKALEQ